MNGTIEKRIEDYVTENYKTRFSVKEVSEMTIQHRMSLVGMKDRKKWEEFKLDLRKAGYII